MKIFGIRTHVRDNLGLFFSSNFLYRAIFGKNRTILFHRGITRKIIKHYNGDDGQNVDFEYGGLGYGLIHYALIINTKPDNILCIGSRKGFIPALCSLACQENEKGTVHFVDAGYDSSNKEKYWSGIGWWKKIDSNKHFSFLDINKHLKTYVMTSQEYAKKYKTKYLYVYIDGDHSYNGAKADYELFWPRLKKGGFMIFHDIVVKNQPKQPPFGVWKLWNEIIKNNKNTVSITKPIYSGLGIIQKI